MKKMTASAKPPLAREEWDFVACPEGHEYLCWAYEFARECPKIRAAVQASRNNLRSGKARKYDPALDEDLNWHGEISICGSDGEVEDVTTLALPLSSFPHAPYLKLGHRPRTSSRKYSDFLLSFSIRDAGKTKIGSEKLGASSRANLVIDWRSPDKTLRLAFARWLKRRRPFPAKSQTGKSTSRRLLTDLKALGAYRLLKTMTVPEAMERTRTTRSRPLFMKPSDWSKAKRRAQQVLREYFHLV